MIRLLHIPTARKHFNLGLTKKEFEDYMSFCGGICPCHDELFLFQFGGRARSDYIPCSVHEFMWIEEDDETN